MRFDRLGKLFFSLSISFPLFMIPLNYKMNIYMFFKLLILFFALIFYFVLPNHKLKNLQNEDKAVLLFLIVFFISFTWGDFNIETLSIVSGYFFSIFLTYFLFRLYNIIDDFNPIYVYIFIFIELFIHFYFIGPQRGAINSAYILGTTSIFLITVIKDVSHHKFFLKYIMAPIYLFFSGFRFVVAHVISFIKIRPLHFFIIAFFTFIFVSYLSYSSNEKFYYSILGYRVFEYRSLIDHLTFIDFFFGKGIGSDFEFFDFKYNRVYQHVGIFHNIVITLVFQIGFIGLFLFYRIFYFVLINNNENLLSLLLITWLILSFVDGPRDGPRQS